VHNGSSYSYGELGSDAAKKVLENKLPAGMYKTAWLTGWLMEWEE
jgi:hypothetical protein